jgi:hypothetical protein
MDPFRFCLVLGPLAFYFILLGRINWSRKPFLITGGRDIAALGVAVSGMIFVGPVELLLPTEAVANFQVFLWLLLLVMYSLCVSLAALLARPRLTIYNISTDELWPILTSTVAAIDPDARWAGTNIWLPNQQVELHIQSSPPMRNVTLVATGDRQSYDGWQRLESILATRLSTVKVPANPWGPALSMMSLAMFLTIAWHLVKNPQVIVQSFHNMFRL